MAFLFRTKPYVSSPMDPIMWEASRQENRMEGEKYPIYRLLTAMKDNGKMDCHMVSARKLSGEIFMRANSVKERRMEKVSKYTQMEVITMESLRRM